MGLVNSRKFGSPMALVMSRVEFDTNGGCWLWSGAPNTYGYGQVSWDDNLLLAPRVAYESRHGSVPDGMIVCHHCDVPQCVNPDHLFAGTSKDNTQDMLAKGRHWVPRGENSPNAKLTDAQVWEIRRRHAHGETQRSLGEEFGVSRGAVGDIVRYRNFKHLEN